MPRTNLAHARPSGLPMASCLLFVLVLAPGAVPASEAVRADRADAAITALLAGDEQATLRDFAPAARAQIPEGSLVQAAQALRTQLGEPIRRDPPRHGCTGPLPVLWQRLAFAPAELDAKVSFDGNDHIIGLLLVPPESAVPCPGEDAPAAAAEAPVAVPEGVAQTAVTVGAQGWPLDGFLTRPTRGCGFPAVVLVHGSGALDADETVFGNKPFRDLAHGLAGHGIASLRYNKRTLTHGERLRRELPDYTIEEETIADAVAAVRWLRSHEDIDPARVFVLGHSLGGMAAPAIGERLPNLAGLIVVAGPSRPAEDLLLEQVRHLADSQGISEAQIDELEGGRQRIKALARGESVEGPLPLAMSASWWRSLSALDPVGTARGQSLPLLVLHGGRDYQVTVADFEGWKGGLADRADVGFRLYPRLNHLFIAGDQPSMPTEYLRPGRVDPDVIADVADWIEGTGRAAR